MQVHSNNVVIMILRVAKSRSSPLTAFRKLIISNYIVLKCFRVGVDPEEEEKKSTFVSVSTVGFVPIKTQTPYISHFSGGPVHGLVTHTSDLKMGSLSLVSTACPFCFLKTNLKKLYSTLNILSIFTHMYKWYQKYTEGNPLMDLHPIQGRSNLIILNNPICFMQQKPGKALLVTPVGLKYMP